MTETRFYEMSVTCKLNDGEVVDMMFDNVWFSTDEDNYGNGTYLRIGNGKYYDIRYDTSYKTEEEMSYLVGWAEHYWSGKNGARKLMSVKVTRKE